MARGETNLESENSTDGQERRPAFASDCSFCGITAAADDPAAYQEIISWVRGKKKDSSVLRVYTGRIACPNCINKLRAGIAPDQISVVEALSASVGTVPEAEYNLPTDRSAAYFIGLAAGLSGEAFIERYHILSDEYHDHREGWHEGNAQREARDIFGGAAQ